MDNEVFVIVIFAAFLHASWNALVKNHEDKYLGLSAIVFGQVPIAIILIFHVPFPSLESLPYLILSAFIHNGYYFFLLSSYRFGDYSVVYPISRGFAVILIAIISLILFAVKLSYFELIGILIVCMGIFSLSFQNSNRLKNYKGIIYSLATGVFIMSYSLVDGYGARINGSFLSYMAYLFPIEGLLFLILLNLIKKREIIKKIIKNSKFSFFVGGTISSLVYILIVWAFTKAPIPLITTLRETSIIFALIIGAIFLKEKFTSLKIFAVLSIFFGVVFLKFF